MSRVATRVAVALAVALVGIGVIALLVNQSSAPAGVAVQSPTAPVPGSGQLVRADSHVVGDPGDGSVVLVEFLDFECEACGAWYPAVETLRQRYDGQVRFVQRYFPLPGHTNAMNAALAVEAAAQQGAYELMYGRMFQTQSEWGESQDSQAALFRGFAQDLGLDLTAYDAVVGSPQTRERIERDVEDGKALGVQGTPTFFLNGELIQPSGIEEFTATIDRALEASE